MEKLCVQFPNRYLTSAQSNVSPINFCVTMMTWRKGFQAICCRSLSGISSCTDVTLCDTVILCSVWVRYYQECLFLELATPFLSFSAIMFFLLVKTKCYSAYKCFIQKFNLAKFDIRLLIKRCTHIHIHFLEVFAKFILSQLDRVVYNPQMPQNLNSKNSYKVIKVYFQAAHITQSITQSDKNLIEPWHNFMKPITSPIPDLCLFLEITLYDTAQH